MERGKKEDWAARKCMYYMTIEVEGAKPRRRLRLRKTWFIFFLNQILVILYLCLNFITLFVHACISLLIAQLY